MISTEKIFASAASGSSSLVSLSLQLLAQQKREWERLAEGYASLNSVLTREVRCDGFSVWLQFNPLRMVSTAANVDPAAIRARPCFLCVENLPEEQRGILFEERYLVLCNPAPIFHQHFTISHVEHRAQEVERNVNDFLELARAMGPEFTVFYNGPRCGASAPDHLHFQSSPADAIPVEQDAVDPARRKEISNASNVQLSTLQNYGRSVIILESQNSAAMRVMVERCIDAIRRFSGESEEPMMNILCRYGDEGWRLILFPRKKHRPAVYFRDGADRILVSPAAVDIGGLVITPLEKDFRRIDAPLIEEIFREVSLEEENLADILGSLSYSPTSSRSR